LGDAFEAIKNWHWAKKKSYLGKEFSDPAFNFAVDKGKIDDKSSFQGHSDSLRTCVAGSSGEASGGRAGTAYGAGGTFRSDLS
jgi:hypothetical protein